MPITHAQIGEAQAVQNTAASDPRAQVRVVAGPGTGKSAAIEQRVCGLLEKGIPAQSIHVVSFTRASAMDLQSRVHQRGHERGLEDAGHVRVSTLHSLALRMLRAGDQLHAYPADPIVLDDWELENIFDNEFGHVHSLTKTRREQIRRGHEAFWCTGEWGPANYIPPDPPITQAERASFNAFHGPRTQTYACVLPGEIVRLCVSRMDAGVLEPVELLKLRHLIVDEFQDLNAFDLRFVDLIIQQGVTVFVAGDDDQSIYSFRFASPSGIQRFHETYPRTGQHQLNACFRCATAVLAAGTALITANPGANRIPKKHRSLYEDAEPPVGGTVHRWRFASAVGEAKAIAQSCKRLIRAGVHARDILILLSNRRLLAGPLVDALEQAKIEAEHPRQESFLDTNTGRLILALLRVVCNRDDYVSHRAILGLRSRVGVCTCNRVSESVIENNLNYRSLYYEELPPNVFTGHELTAIRKARDTCAAIADWEPVDTLEQRSNQLCEIIENHFSAEATKDWHAFIADLPLAITLEELRNYLWADTDEQQAGVFECVFERLKMDIPEGGMLQPRVRIMTMHGAKGLSARVVFVPGFEEQIFPGPWRQPYPGLILEAARLLYVSVTRARAACVITYCTNRIVYGKLAKHAASRFAQDLNGAFEFRKTGLTEDEIERIVADCANL